MAALVVPGGNRRGIDPLRRMDRHRLVRRSSCLQGHGVPRHALGELDRIQIRRRDRGRRCRRQPHLPRARLSPGAGPHPRRQGRAGHTAHLLDRPPPQRPSTVVLLQLQLRQRRQLVRRHAAGPDTSAAASPSLFYSSGPSTRSASTPSPRRSWRSCTGRNSVGRG